MFRARLIAVRIRHTTHNASVLIVCIIVHQQENNIKDIHYAASTDIIRA